MKGQRAVTKQWFKSSKGRCRAAKSRRRWGPCLQQWGAVTLRPVNVNGNRARGMSAPENTNQFLMTEKYRLQALRSDSVDSSDNELTDMDSYLGAWENARGALLDSPDQDRGQARARDRLSVETVFFLDHEEDSVQYFPSEDDLLQSDHFMHRDFVEFCDKVTS